MPLRKLNRLIALTALKNFDIKKKYSYLMNYLTLMIKKINLT